MSDTFENYIDGRRQDATTQQTFENRNPADPDDLIGHFPNSGPTDVDEAAAAARDALDEWSSTPAPDRGKILKASGDLLTERKEDIARSMTREMGKPFFETKGDVQEAIDTARSEERRVGKECRL